MTVRLNHIKVTGLGLTDDFLLELADRAQTGKIKNATAASYSVDPNSLEEAVQDAWDSARKLWAKVQQANPGGTAQPGWENFVRPLLTRMGYTASFVRPQASAQTAAQQRFPISYLSETGDVPVHFSNAERLDSVTDESGVRISPHGLMQGYLNATPEHLWGLVTNGKTVRLLRDHGQVTRPAYLEFSLDEIMGAEDSRAFRVLWLLLHRSRLKGGTGSLLEGWNEAAKQSGVKARDTLRDGVKGAIEALGTGFLTGNPALLGAVKDGQITPTDLYRACLKLVYQLVFLFVTEDRDLLFARDENGGYVPDAATRDRARHYLTRALRNRAAVTGSETHADTYEGLKFLLSRVRTGFPNLGLPALGSHLFVPHPLGEIEGQPLTPADLRLSNAALHRAVLALSEISVNGTRRPVNYAGLDSEELGSIYESLLELVPRVNPGPAFALEVLAGNERKTTGSYYTPSSLIDLLLDSALDPVIADAVNGKPDAEAIAALKALKVIDPACGSGHFLIAAARRIGAKLAALEEGTAQPSPEALRRAGRSVIAHCIYGADINPLAVELAKVALWLESQDAGKPLAFLDHRLRVGNSLLGTTPELMNTEDEIPEKMVKRVLKPAVRAHTLHLPDDAFSAIEGDDKKTVSELKKRNKQEREALIEAAHGAQGLFNADADLAPLTAMLRALDKIEPESLDNVRAQESTFAAIRQNAALIHQKLLADAWCAAFIALKVPNAPAITTATLNALKTTPDAPALADVRALVATIARQYRFLHPHLEFPDVFEAGQGGFNCVLGNPPWERIKLQEKEWFAQRVPEIAKAANTAARARKINELKMADHQIYTDFRGDLRKSESESHFIRSSNRFPFNGNGDINTYAIFAELCRSMLSKKSRMGLILPIGITTDKGQANFFADLMSSNSLISVDGFINTKKIFSDVKDYIKFCILVVSNRSHFGATKFVYGALGVGDTKDPEKFYFANFTDIIMTNPVTKNSPVFLSRYEAEITIKTYNRIMIQGQELNGWQARFERMIDMSNDSDRFVDTESQNTYPLYEGKFIWQFDHRFSTYENATQQNINEGNLPQLNTYDHQNKDKHIQPRYWIESDLSPSESSWRLGYRSIASAGNERTLIASILPNYFFGHSLPLINLNSSNLLKPAFLANFNSFIMDFFARQKIGGANVSLFILNQLPFLPLPAFTTERLSFIAPRVLELTYTAHDLSGFAADLGYAGGPFTWNDERRFWLRAELDALYFILYGIGREDVAYIMDTFPIVRRKDEAAHGGVYRTREAILSVYDELQRVGLEKLGEYQSRLEIPPADPRVAHGYEKPVLHIVFIPELNEFPAAKQAIICAIAEFGYSNMYDANQQRRMLGRASFSEQSSVHDWLDTLHDMHNE